MKIRFLRLAFLFCAGLFLAQAALAQNPPMATVIKSQAIDMGRALVSGDVAKFGSYMHPTLVQKAGGPEKMRAMADSMNKLFVQFGAQVTKLVFGNPADVVKHQQTLQTTLSQTTYLTTLMGDIELTSTLVAISLDQGKHWYFIDTTIYQERALRRDLPEISPALVIPPPQKPKITPKEE